MPDYSVMTDQDLQAAYEAAIRRHDWLIDNADMGDERIYFAGKTIDATRAEMASRKSLQPLNIDRAVSKDSLHTEIRE